jgi:hypothetical protein
MQCKKFFAQHALRGDREWPESRKNERITEN